MPAVWGKLVDQDGEQLEGTNYLKVQLDANSDITDFRLKVKSLYHFDFEEAADVPSSLGVSKRATPGDFPLVACGNPDAVNNAAPQDTSGFDMNALGYNFAIIAV